MHHQPGQNSRIGRWVLTVLVLMLALQVHAQEALAKKIALTLQEASPKQSLIAIQKASGSRILFGEDINKFAGNKVTIKNEAITVKQALELALKNTNLVFEQVSGNILIKEKPAPQTPTSPKVQAGQGVGGIKGRIVDFETSDPLPGATVRVISQQQVMVSDEQGYYQFPNAKAGKYTLEVSYIGFTTVTQEVNIIAGKVTTYDIKLQGSNQLNEVVITAIGKKRAPVAHTSNKQLLTEIKELSVVASGISSQQISMSADRNAAQVMQRISGVTVVDEKFVVVRGLNQRYNLTYLNDNVAPSTEAHSRAFALDLIPSRIIDKVLVFKSPSPENLADATGGVIKIYTKDAKEVKHFDVEFQLGYRPGMSFNNNFLTYNGGKTDFLGFDNGTRALPKALPGYGSLLRSDFTPSQYAEMFSPTLAYGKKTALPNMQFTANYYNAYKLFGNSLSLLASLSYKNDNEKIGKIYQEGLGEGSFNTLDRMGNEDRNTNSVQTNMLLNFTYKLNENSTFYFKNFLLQQGVDATVIRNSWRTWSIIDKNAGAIRNKDLTLAYNQRFLYGGNLSAKHKLKTDNHELNWNLGYLYSKQDIPDQRVIRFTGIEQNYSLGNADLQWVARGATPDVVGEYTDPLPKALGMISRFWSQNNESVYNGALDYTYKTTPSITLKAGTFHQVKIRELDRRIYTIHEGSLDDPDKPLHNFVHYSNPNLIRYHMQDLSNIWADSYFKDDYSGLQVHDRTSGGDTYRGTEQNNSAYVLLNYAPANRLVEIHGGVRYEYNRQKIAAAIPPRLLPGINIPIHIDNPMHSFLPSINVSVRPNKAWVGRMSYGKTLNRTEFREVSPFKELDFANNVTIQGNPLLVSAKADNYDARIEFYPNEEKSDAVNFGYFYKRITNPIERVNATNRILSDFPSISFNNASSATVGGWEMELRKSLDFLPGGFFQNLSFTGNASWIKSKVKYDQISYASNSSDPILIPVERPLQGQSPYLINAGLYYENAGWGSKIGIIYNTTGDNIYAVGRHFEYNEYISGPTYRGSLIELRRDLLDFSFTQRVGKGLQLRLSIQNILDEPIMMIEDYNFNYKYDKEIKQVPQLNHHGQVVQRWDGDNTASTIKPGRYYSLNISYSF